MPAPSSIAASAVIARSTSTGPRLHDYSIPNGITHVRPGVLGVPTGPHSEDGSTSTMTRALPVPVPVNTSAYRDRNDAAYSFVSGASSVSVESWGSPVSLMTHAQSSSVRSSAYEGVGGVSVSVPPSSVRSASGSGSGSRSRSGSAGADGEVVHEVEMEKGEDEFGVDMDMDDGEGSQPTETRHIELENLNENERV